MSTRKRKTITKTQRFEVFKRDQFTCQYCGATPPKAVLHIEHVVPFSKGGADDESNWITACSVCNAGKGVRSLNDVPKSLAEKAAEVQEREEQLAGYVAIMDAQRNRMEDEAWAIMAILKEQPVDEVTALPEQITSLKTFMKRGLARPDLVEAAEIARLRPKERAWRYFCGVCWNKIREAEGNG